MMSVPPRPPVVVMMSEPPAPLPVIEPPDPDPVPGVKVLSLDWPQAATIVAAKAIPRDNRESARSLTFMMSSYAQNSSLWPLTSLRRTRFI